MRLWQDAFTKRAQKVKLAVFDFDGVLTDNHVYVFGDGAEAVRCSRADGIGLARLQAAGIGVVVLTNEASPIVEVRCRKLGVPHYFAEEGKEAPLLAILSQYKVMPDETAYLGNDINDVPCLDMVGLPVVVVDAIMPAVYKDRYFWTSVKGGDGAVRELCDRLLKARKEL